MYTCSFCRKQREVVAKGPGVCICETCLAKIEPVDPATQEERRCSFCHQAEGRYTRWFRSYDRTIAATDDTGEVRICSCCTPTMRRVLEHDKRLAESERARANMEDR